MAKGTLYLMISQIIFLGSGYIIHFGTARLVSPVEYGRLGVVLAILQILQIFLFKGIPDAVTKYISEGRDPEKTKKVGLKIQFIFSLIIFIMLIVFAPFISYVLKDSYLTIYILLMSVIIPVRALYTLFVGYLNGLREFAKVSILFGLNSFSRIIFVFIFLFIGLGIVGVIGGYICGSLIALTIGIYYFVSQSKTKGKNITSKEIIKFASPMIVFSTSYLILMNLDLIFIKALLNDPSYTGYYTAARMLSSVIFGVLLGLSFSLLPSISKSVAEKDILQTKSYINHSLRYMLMAIVPICIILSIYANGIITFFYPTEYGLASTSLSILIFGTVFISIFVILGTVINGAGKPKSSMLIGIMLVFIYIILNYFLIKEYGLIGGAWATFIVGAIGVIVSGIIVYKDFKILLEFISFFKIIVAGLVIAAIGFFVEASGFILICWTLVLFMIYAGILYIIKEFKKEDFKLIREILIKK
jgi:O-antigen/teichoic acid export membrane protein